MLHFQLDIAWIEFYPYFKWLFEKDHQKAIDEGLKRGLKI